MVEALAAEFGLNVTLEKGGHLKVRTEAGGTVVTCSSSPSDHRALKNIRTDIRNALRRKDES